MPHKMFVAIAILLLPSLVNGLCYTPDGDLSNDVPCNPDAPDSVCCIAGYICTSNGLCQTPERWHDGHDIFTRGTCTDQSWEVPECKGICVKENPSGGEPVIRCESDVWCCYHSDCCSDEDAQMLTIGAADLTGTAGVWEGTTVTSASSGVTTDSSSSTTGSSVAETTSANPEAADQDDGEGSDDDALPIGLGVGLGVGIPAIALTVGLWIWWRRRHRPSTVLANNSGGDQGGRSHSVEPKANIHEVASPAPVGELRGSAGWVQTPGGASMPPAEMPVYEQEAAFRRRAV